MIRTVRVYDEDQSGGESRRYLVDGLWPRGVKRESLGLDGWSRAVAPGAELRRWFAHDPAKWDEFRSRYFAELDAIPDAWQPLLEAARAGDLTLLYGARDRERNNAVALREYLERKLAD
ncbi:MAG: DUF488 domain-containing protein [Chloroflexota bacterium]